MECRKNQDFCYAVNSSGNIINVLHAKRNESYKCPYCHSIMVPHMGPIRKWHFTHKFEKYCIYESYLHKVAKARIREAFLKADKFFISFDTYKVCSANCPFKQKKPCVFDSHEPIDIKEYYDICEEETEYAGFRPDLILKSSVNPKRQPIFIEILVSHQSSVRKINSGIRIIEIIVESYKVIDKIVSSCTIKGYMHSRSDYSTERKQITFYNFKNKEYIKPSDKFYRRKHVFALKDDASYITFTWDCFESLEKKFHSGEYNLIISDSYIPVLWALYEFQRRGLNITNCISCKHVRHDGGREYSCMAFYTRYSDPKIKKLNQAQSCPHYEIRKENEVGTSIDKLAPYSYKIIMRK